MNEKRKTEKPKQTKKQKTKNKKQKTKNKKQKTKKVRDQYPYAHTRQKKLPKQSPIQKLFEHSSMTTHQRCSSSTEHCRNRLCQLLFARSNLKRKRVRIDSHNANNEY
jgi:hypothetical protein